MDWGGVGRMAGLAKLRVDRGLLAVKLALLAGVLVLTNPGVGARMVFLATDNRLLTLLIFSGLWLCALAAMVTAAFHPRPGVRLLWAVPVSVAGAAAYGYHVAQGAEFFIYDLLNFWSARHEVGRAATFFANAIIPAVAVFAVSLLAFAMPPGFFSSAGGHWKRLAAIAPVAPILLIALVVLYRQGKGSEAMPKQFAPLALASLASYKINTAAFPERQPVRMSPGKPLSRAVVMIVDESIRADFINLTPGNALTPQMAAESRRWIDFGPAVSAGNCSNISNALLRFMARRDDLFHSVLTSPTVWQYARAAGFRTVYIDAQAGFIRVYGKLQNFMTPGEAVGIDRLHKLDSGSPAHALDDELVNLVLDELAAGDRVFIYANKNGAHFPYQDNAPPGFTPGPGADAAMEAGAPASYGRAISWSTDRTMARLVRESSNDDTTLIYTSDHGQHFSPNRLTHCSALGNVDPQEGIVPLMVATGDRSLQERFVAATRRIRGRASHFAIAPTLLELMGYSPADIAEIYTESLLDDIREPPRFVSGDIFGLFGQRPAWHDVDPAVQERRAKDMVSDATPDGLGRGDAITQAPATPTP